MPFLIPVFRYACKLHRIFKQKSESSLDMSELVNDEEKPFKCITCGKKFATVSNLSHHTRKKHFYAYEPEIPLEPKHPPTSDQC